MTRTALILAILIAVSPSAAVRAEGSGDSASVQDQRLAIKLGDRDFSLAARVFRPAGPGPFPLVVINHGTPVSIADASRVKLGFSQAAQWFVSQGYAVVVALRPGFGDSDGPYMERSTGQCDDRDYVHDGRATAAVEAAIAESAAALPGIDPHRIVVVGQSAGGFGAIALADAPPPGVIAVISFAGGRGGDDHEHLCSGKRLVEAAAIFGKANQLPQLWLYAANDHFFPPEVGHVLFQAYQAGSTPPLRFVDLPPFDGDGHKTFGSADPSVWSPAVANFLAEIAKPPAR